MSLSGCLRDAICLSASGRRLAMEKPDCCQPKKNGGYDLIALALVPMLLMFLVGCGQDATTANTPVTSVNSPTVALTSAPKAVTSGNSSMLSWVTANANSCTASGGWSGSLATSGSQSTGAISTTTTYTLACTGAAGSATQSVTVTVTPTILGSPATSVTVGNSYSFTPTATGASGATLSFSVQNKPSWASFSPTTGTLSGTPTSANVGSYTGIVISVSDGTTTVSLPAFSIMVNAVVAVNGAPVILYTDIVAGPNTGGEDNDGDYLSIFGVNFGSTIANVTVTVGGGAVARYIYLGPSNGRADIQQLSVQLGPNATSGAIVVTVNGLSSNTDQTFTVSAGK